MSKDPMGDRIKTYEKLYSQQTLPKTPVVVRLDGKNFSRFTKRFSRPFDDDLKNIMLIVTKRLAEEANAVIGYTQSDEITLILNTDNPKGQLYFNGEVNKLNSVLASMASSLFTKEMVKWDYPFLEENTLISFDCRAFSVSNKEEAVNALFWRYKDAIKNSVTQVIQEKLSHKQLQGMSLPERRKWLEDNNDPWEVYADIHKEGAFIRKIDKYEISEFGSGFRFGDMTFQEKLDWVFEESVNNDNRGTRERL